MYVKSYMVISPIIWIIAALCVAGYLFENKKGYKIYYLNIYMAINMIFANSIVLNAGMLYFIGMNYENQDVFNYWLYNLFILFMSMVGLVLFGRNAWESEVTRLTKFLRNLGIVIIIGTLLALAIIWIVAPTIGDESRAFFIELMFLALTNLLNIRAFFHYQLAKDEINGVGKIDSESN
ncbi:hypothetical protein GCM10010896_16480 [Mammaliicoccus stepanovicii]|uniref:Membrane protein n=1 Tax=Mammaliicoccus stepanovicii TaxID=643214 RepID=A0A239ZCF5_9STAP|nr:hypothetical protein GCM10010896_16480 [Mammaliicoccus stepanovicii]SNV68673.1 membrane protein [Mammaliicoccus stepanovicii]